MAKKASISYSFREPNLPEPVEKIDKGSGRVSYGKDNLHPQWLYQVYYESPIHQGIVNQKVIFVIGNGVEAVGEWAGISDEVQRNGRSDYTLDEVVEGAAMDFEVLEYYYLLFKRDELTGKWIVEHLPGELMRPTDGLVWFEYSEDWKQKSQDAEKTGYKRYLSIFEYDSNPELNEYVMYVRTVPKQIKIDKKLTSSIFPIPSYSGALTSILADIEMNWYHYSESVNAFTSDTHVNFPDGVREEDEMDKLADRWNDNTTNRRKKGGSIVTSSDGKELAPTIARFGQTGNDSRYIITQEHITSAIMIGHSVQNAALFGLEVAGKLGGSIDVQSAFARFNETYCNRRRKNIAESITYGLRKLAKLPEGGEIKFKEYSPTFEKQVTADNKTASALNGMSPLVANSVLNNLTVNEIRALAGLPAIEGGDALNKSQDTTGQAFSKSVISMFENSGRPVSEFKFEHSDAFDGRRSDEDFAREYARNVFAVDLTDDQRLILKMIGDGETYNAIVNAVGKGARYVSRQLITLESEGYISRDSPKMELTTSGNTASENVQNIQVLYTYETRPDVPAAKSGSRPFCERMLSLNRAYTRDEINAISAAIGRDVWLYRGGWYHNPESDKNTPSCRHYWKQNIVIA